MTALLERYERQATLLEGGPSLGFLEEAVELAAIERKRWTKINRSLRDVPVAGRQGWREQAFQKEPPVVNQTTIAAAADTILWDPAGLAPNTAIPANSIYAGQIFVITAFGVTTTAVTAGQTLIANPRFGTTNAGVSLGVSRTAPINAAVKTNVDFFLEMWVHFRSIGPLASGGTAMCGGMMTAETIIGTAATTNVAPLQFGGGATTAIAVNTTAASGLLVSLFPSLATQTFTCTFVNMETNN